MANFIPNKKTASDFNNGIKYSVGDSIQANSVNNLVEATLYAQEQIELVVGNYIPRTGGQVQGDLFISYLGGTPSLNIGRSSSYTSYQGNKIVVGERRDLPGEVTHELNLPFKDGTIALLEDITVDTSNIVTTDTEQEITGHKTFVLNGGAEVDFTVMSGGGGIVLRSQNKNLATRVRSVNEIGGMFYAYDANGFGYTIYRNGEIAMSPTEGIDLITFGLPKESGTLARLEDIHKIEFYDTLEDANLREGVITFIAEE